MLKPVSSSPTDERLRAGPAPARQILEDLARNQASDGRRLQALLSDFCGDRQAVLLPALRHLVQSAGFNRALQQQPPLAANP